MSGSYGLSWGSSWGNSWGFQQGGGGGGSAGGSAGASKGWVRERQIFEQSRLDFLRKAQATLRKTEQPAAKKIAQLINKYEVGNLEIDELRKQNAILLGQIKNKEEFAKELTLASIAIDEFLAEEQEAIEVLLADFELSAQAIMLT